MCYSQELQNPDSILTLESCHRGDASPYTHPTNHPMHPKLQLLPASTLTYQDLHVCLPLQQTLLSDAVCILGRNKPEAYELLIALKPSETAAFLKGGDGCVKRGIRVSIARPFPCDLLLPSHYYRRRSASHAILAM